MYVISSWSGNTNASMCRSPLEKVMYEFVLTSPAASCMFYSSNLDGFRDWKQVAVQALFKTARSIRV